MAEPKAEPKSRYVYLIGRAVRELITVVLPALVFALFVNVYVVEAVAVEHGPSMQPNLYIGYRVITEKISYRFHLPHRGDVIVVEQPENETALIKRVVAVAGEVVEVRGGHTFVDGQPIDEPWVTNFGGQDYPARLVPPDHVFILGDNRGLSRDSRAIGPVPVDTIMGHALFIYWPLDEIKLLP